MAYNQSDDEEDNRFLGTPFAPLEDKQIVSRKPDLDLTVRDSKGRRRFHGAFTGGFSAGHFMTVGSEEGFTPQQFVSNRNQKWDQTLIQRKPENFMDDEDLDVFGIAPQKITTKDKFVEEEFAGFRKTDSLIDVLKSVIKPTTESIGRKLYKRMKLNAKKDSYLQSKVYGCDLSSIRNTDKDFSVSYKPKSDFHGIGYKSIAEESDPKQTKSSNGVSAVFKSGRKIQISGEAFGYGALEEEDDDIQEDAVVYHKDDMSQYDFEIGSLKKDSKQKNKHKGNDVLKSDYIEGFTKSSNKINLIEKIRHKFPIPVIPKDWKSPSNQSKQKKSRWDQKSEATKAEESNQTFDSNDRPKAPVLNANVRAILLGEEVIHRQGVKKVDTSEVKEPTPHKQTETPAARPLFGFWANKFTRSSVTFEESTLSGGLTQIKADIKERSADEQNKTEDNKSIKRTTYEWHPHTLLCKRFNIPNPFPQYPDFVGVVTVGKSDVRNRTSQISDKKSKQNIFECLFTEQAMSGPTDSVETKPKTVDNKSEESDEENEDPSRPPMDLFKAIFASDEESDGEDNEEDKSDSNKTVNNESDLMTNKPIEPKTTEPNTNKSRGIFANIDFDQLNRDFTTVLESNETQKPTKNESKTNEKPEEIVNSSKNSEPIDDYYGPALPPDSSFLSSSIYLSSELSQTSNQRKSSKRKKKDKSKKQNKQNKHKKHKTNHKKHKRQKKSSDSDSSSDDNIEQKILKHLKTVRNSH